MTNLNSPKTPKATKCLKCDNCDAIHTSVLNDSVSSCPSGIQKCAACITVDKLKLEVEGTMERLKELLQDLRQAKMQMNQRHSTIFNKLPAEILYSVFESYVSDPVAPGYRGETFSRHFRREKMARPTVLSQVCSQWRQVALAIPQIWTTVVLMWDVSAEEEIDRVREWISHTRGFPLDMYMVTSMDSLDRSDDWPCPFNSVHPSFFPLLQAIASTSVQWRYFTAHAPYCVLEYLGQHMKHLGLLKEMNIRPVFSKYSPSPLWAYCQPAPKSVQLIDCLPNKMNIQWSAVTTIKVAYMTTEQCLTLLSSASNLITCVFEDVRREKNEERSRHISRPSIKHEKIKSFTYDSNCSFIFYRLKLPNLRSFTCRLVNFDENHEGFFKSVSDLKELGVLSISYNAEMLRSMLSKMPGTVADLSLTCEKNYSHPEIDSMVEVLRVFDQTAVVNTNTNAKTDGLILPNLTSLEIRADTEEFPWNYVPKCFGPIVGNIGERNGLRRRPLSRFRVTDETKHRSASDDDKRKHLIPADVLKELVALQRNGAEIMFQHMDGVDMLARSIVNAGLDNFKD
ncbi:hypothetical protein D9613_004551 [Agrocybe pediades]|uniref:F-box domain-containing protein n=1 Tax=Agrocybe pediades TaxID=84607 RepID=A0A8H4VIK3_9AGAR|nr:hypothetical protein D9613_004551 [Agrocybe pediades]